MPFTRRRFNGLLLAALGTSLGGSLVPAAALADLVEGRDWRPVDPPQPPAVPGKIEVLEFFSYTCPHCGQLNPLIEPWAARLPEDVVFRRIPVTFGRASAAPLARLYLALEQIGELGRLDQAVFDAAGKERAKLFTDKAVLAWVERQGVAREPFEAAYRGFSTEMQMKRAESLVQRYRIEAVPTLAVDGRYVVVGAAAKGYEDLLAIADRLIEKARQGAGRG